MKTKNLPATVHHHYHYAGGFNPIPFIVIGILILSTIWGFCDPSYPPNRVFRGTHGITNHALFTSQYATTWSIFWSHCYSSYWHFLNSSVVLFGWRGYGFFWAQYPSWSVVIFLGIPIVGVIGIFFLVSFLFKRPRLMKQIIVILYAWHCGMSNLLHNGVQWTSFLLCILIVTSFFLSLGLIDFLRRKVVDWSHYYFSQMNNQWNALKGLILNHS